MKKLLLGLLPLACVAITSCGGGETKDTRTYSSPAYNFITSLDGSEEPVVLPSVYNISVDAIASTLTLSCPSLTLPTGTINFTTSPMSALIAFATPNNRYSLVYLFNAKEAGSGSTDINSVTGYYTQAVYFPNNEFGGDAWKVPGYSWYFPTNTYFYLYAQYKIGNSWYVRTFWPDATYHGKTETSYPGAKEPFTTEDITYRIILQTKDGALTGKADLLMYDAKFAAQMPQPLKCIKAEGFDVELTNSGYVITGSNIVPYYYESGWTEYNERIFTDFRAEVNGDLTDISISYTLANVFKGTFRGSCIVKAEK